MYHAITIKNGRITGRHESTGPITGETFAVNGPFHGHEVREIAPEAAYESGFLLTEYDQLGQLRPLLDRIHEGLREVPEGFEVLEGKLVAVEAPAKEAPETVRVLIDRIMAENVDLKAKLEAALMPMAGLLKNYRTIQSWAEIKIGETVPVGSIVISVFIKYRAIKEHKKSILIPALDSTNWEKWEG